MPTLINSPRPRYFAKHFFRDVSARFSFSADLLGNAVDKSVNRLVGSVVNATVARGPFGPCYNFATNGRISYARNNFIPDADHTWGMWVSARSLASGRRALEYNPLTQASGGDSVYLSISSTGNGIMASTISTGGAWQSWAFGAPLLTGRWYFLAVTYDKAASWTHLFFDGKPVSGYSQTRGRFGGEYDTWIGGNANNTASTYQWDGYISECFCLKRVLSPLEILAYYRNMVQPEYTKLFAGAVPPPPPFYVSVAAGDQKNTIVWS